LQTALFFRWPYPFVSRCQRRFGDIFTLTLATPGEDALGSIVYLADPSAIKEVFSRDGKEGHAGMANAVLEPIIGTHSLLVLDREQHLQERRLLGPAFHGDAIKGLESIAREAAEREVAGWSADSVFALRPAMQRITFEVIMRAVLGVHDRDLQDRLLAAFEPVFNLSVMQIVGLLPALRLDLGSWTLWGRLQHNVSRLDELLLDLSRAAAAPSPATTSSGCCLPRQMSQASRSATGTFATSW
jgi:cytochrome P450